MVRSLAMAPGVSKVSWAGSRLLAAALAVSLAGAFRDMVVLTLGGEGISAIVGAGLAAAALGGLLVVAASPAAALAVTIVRRWSWARIPLSASVVGALGWWILDPPRRQLMAVYVGMVAVAAGVGALLMWLSSARPAGRARGCAAAIAVGLWVADHALLSPTIYLELHDLGTLLWIAAVLAAAGDLGRVWRHRSRSWLMAALAGVVALWIAACFVVDPLFDRWRSVAADHSLAVNGLIRAARAVVDVDRDGYSPIAWGADCDDLDGDRHPRAIDEPGGGDGNCNGVDPPAEPGDDDRGFTAPFGEPMVDTDTDVDVVDVVVLISVDTLRADAFHPEVMPLAWQHAGRGVRFERLYASSPSTFTSLPLLVRANERAKPVAEALQERGVTTTAIYGGVAGVDRTELGFATVQAVSSARQVTEAGLAALESAGARRHFLWLHYFDPHAPYRAPEPIDTPAALTHLPAGYREAVAYTDRWLGAFIDGIERLGLSSRAAVLFTADHGEAFGEYGEYAHGRTAYDAVLRVPAYVVGPGIPPAVYENLATHRDIVPTILGAFGVPPGERFGRSWWRLRADPTRALHERVFARSSRFSSGREVDLPIGVLVSGHHKLVVDLEDDLARLHDLRQPGGEAIDIASREPALVTKLTRWLYVFADLDGFPAYMARP